MVLKKLNTLPPTAAHFRIDQWLCKIQSQIIVASVLDTKTFTTCRLVMMTKTQCCRNSLEANALAVLYVTQNRSGDAVSSLVGGLKTLLDESIPDSFKYEDKFVCSSSLTEGFPDGCGEGSIHAVHAPPFHNTEMSNSPDHVFSVFNRALIITPVSPSSDLQGNDEYKAIITCVLLYNLGLIFHREGVERGSCVSLRQALNIYETARRAISSRSTMDVNESVLRLISFCLMNNMGHIYGTLFETNAASACRNYLCERSSGFVDVLSTEDYTDLFTNMSLTIGNTNAPAA